MRPASTWTVITAGGLLPIRAPPRLDPRVGEEFPSPGTPPFAFLAAWRAEESGCFTQSRQDAKGFCGVRKNPDGSREAAKTRRDSVGHPERGPDLEREGGV